MNELLDLSKFLASTNKKSLSNRVLQLYKTAIATYTIRPGDNLDKITGGDVRWKKLIMEFNPDVDWNRLQINQIIKFPPRPVRPNESKTYSANLVDFIKREESFRPTEYLDTSRNPTIGFGHKITGDESPAIGPNYVMDRSEAEVILIRDLEDAASYIRRNVDTALNQHQFDAITSLVFNMGGGKFNSTPLQDLLDQNRLSEVGRLIPTTMSKDVESRRQREAQLFTSGVY